MIVTISNIMRVRPVFSPLFIDLLECCVQYRAIYCWSDEESYLRSWFRQLTRRASASSIM